MGDPVASIDIENVVVSMSLDQELNLTRLGEDLPTSQYDPHRFPGLIYRTTDPKAATLIFRTGELVTTGANSEAAATAALGVVLDDLRDLGVAVPDTPSATVQNIVSSADLGQPLQLNAVAVGLGLERTEYEPEQFPGLVYRLEDPSVVVLLFGSGKLVVTGAKTTNEAEAAVDHVHARLTDLGLFD